jgi:zinc/manganese transport system permease protein
MMDVLLNALLLSFVLLGIHAYFGMEVVRRGIIFTDIAIAQASAVGLALSLFLFDSLLTFFPFYALCSPVCLFYFPKG